MRYFLLTLTLAAPLGLSNAFSARAGVDCERGNQDAAALQSEPAGADIRVIAEDTPRDADNTDRNDRDRNGDTLTPLDQGKSEADRTITQRVRKAVVDNDKLSTNAHNVKIVTVDGAVTLRGPVKTAEEKATIEALAHKTSGVRAVDNQLEIKRDL